MKAQARDSKFVANLVARVRQVERVRNVAIGSRGGQWLDKEFFMSTHHYHAVIWIDHHEARVFHFSPTDVERLVLHPDHPTRHIHHKANSVGSGHASPDHNYLHAVAQSIADAGAVLVTGPGNAKTELVKHIREHESKLMNVIVGVETVDHPSDAKLLAYARKYFTAADLMRPQTP
jgi:hypothetical protein